MRRVTRVTRGTRRETGKGPHREMGSALDRTRQATAQSLQSAKAARAASIQETREKIADTLSGVRSRVATITEETRRYLAACRQARSLAAQPCSAPPARRIARKAPKR